MAENITDEDPINPRSQMMKRSFENKHVIFAKNDLSIEPKVRPDFSLTRIIYLKMNFDEIISRVCFWERHEINTLTSIDDPWTQDFEKIQTSS